jgi:phosphatidylinositol alpha-1,6-mannosyltransferase
MPILVSNNYPPTRGGIQTLMSRVAETLAEKGREVVVVGPREDGSDAYDAGLPYRIFRYAARRRPRELFAIAGEYVRALRVARERVTLASVWWPVGFALVFVPRRWRGPLAIFVHGTEVAPSRKGIRQAIMRAVFRRADVIIANSSFTRGLLERAGVGGEIAVVALGVDMAPVIPARGMEPTLLSVGRLVARKGFDRVIDALPALLAEFPSLRYEIVGGGPERSALEARAARLGVAANVTFLGSVSEDDLRGAYARAWCFALPVRNIDDDVEGFGIVYLEAAMASLPAVGGTESGATDAIVDGETGILVDGTSVSAIAEAVATLLRDRTASERMGARGLERARRFTWTRTTDEILAVLPQPERGVKR